MKNRTGFYVLIVLVFGFLFSFLYSCSSNLPTTTQETPVNIDHAVTPAPIINPQDNQHTAITQNNKPIETILGSAIEARKQIVREWIGKTVDVVNTIQDEEAKEVLEFLQNNYVGCLPGKDRIDCGSAAPLRIVPLLLSDGEVSTIWHGYIMGKQIGVYESSEHGIVLKAFIDVGDLYKALILLHEGKHALLDFKNPGHTSEYSTKIMEEVAIRSYIHRIERQVGGTKYQTLIEDRMRAKIPEFSRTGLVTVQTQYNTELDSIFGPTPSQEEKGLRQEELEIAAIFLLFDRQGPLKSNTLKYNFMASVVKLAQ